MLQKIKEEFARISRAPPMGGSQQFAFTPDLSRAESAHFKPRHLRRLRSSLQGLARVFRPVEQSSCATWASCGNCSTPHVKKARQATAFSQRKWPTAQPSTMAHHFHQGLFGLICLPGDILSIRQPQQHTRQIEIGVCLPQCAGNPFEVLHAPRITLLNSRNPDRSSRQIHLGLQAFTHRNARTPARRGPTLDRDRSPVDECAPAHPTPN